MKKDTIYKTKLKKVNDFVFDSKVADVFEDMINRSVPGYGLTLSMIACLANKYAQDNSNCYDLGCALGASTLAMRRAIDKENVKIIAVDNSEAMVEKCRENIKDTSIEIICDDICNIEIKNASVVVLNFTLQFIAPEKRTAFLKKIYQGLLPQGLVFIAEKIKFLNKKEQGFKENLYYTYKKLNGYSELEISQKRDALQNILKSDTISSYEERLKGIGFDEFYICSQCLNFISFCAIKK